MGEAENVSMLSFDFQTRPETLLFSRKEIIAVRIKQDGR